MQEILSDAVAHELKEETICFFFGDFSGSGGAERSAISIANGLAEKGYRVILLSLTSTAPEFFHIDKKIKRLSLLDKRNSLKFNFLNALYRIRSLAKRERVKIWVDVDPIVSVLSAAALISFKTKHVAWEHFNFTNDLGRRERKWGRFIAARFFDAIVVLTKKDRDLWIGALKPRAKISVIYNPCPFEDGTDNKVARSGKLIISVGRLIDLKGYDLLIDAWRQVKNGCGDDWNLVIVGDGPEKLHLEAKIRALGLDSSLFLVGKKRDVASYYKVADIFCLSSRAEGLPMVLIEAQSYGLPCVAFDCLTGPSEIIDHEVNGLLVNPGDTEGLASALKLMMKDERMRLRMSSAAFVSVRKFDRQKIVDQWCRLFAEVSRVKS